MYRPKSIFLPLLLGKCTIVAKSICSISFSLKMTLTSLSSVVDFSRPHRREPSFASNTTNNTRVRYDYRFTQAWKSIRGCDF